MADRTARPNQPTDSYAALLPAALREVREPSERYQAGYHWTERHLQCVWFDDRLRPANLVTRDGETIRVESPGRWNLEAGPDFLDAALRVGREERRITGDVEVHVRPVDWDRHRHDREGLYRGVVLHVTYFSSPPLVSPSGDGLLHLALTDSLAARPAFSFDDVDVAAYPHAILPQTPRPCGLALCDRRDRWESLLASAGRHRMQLKTQRLRERLARVQDRDQLLYEETLAALGYKHHAAAFRRLAQHLPLRIWDPAAPVERACARLLGAAGLLPDPASAEDAESRSFARALWDQWWADPMPAPADAVIELAKHSSRPANAPARRLAAAAAIFHGGARLTALLPAFPRAGSAAPETGKEARRWFNAVASVFGRRSEWEYWRWHWTATGPRQKRPSALLGRPRLAAIAANVVLPLLATEQDLPDGWGEALPSEDLSAPMREAAYALFGRDHNPALYAAHGLYQQGLLQIHHDFCLNARAGCAGCALAAELRQGARP